MAVCALSVPCCPGTPHPVWRGGREWGELRRAKQMPAACLGLETRLMAQLGAEAALTYLSADKLSWAVLCAAFTLPLGS